MEKTEGVRLTITLSPRVKEWIEVKSKEMGVTQNGLISMALNEYIDQKETIKAMGDLSQVMGRLDDISNSINRIMK